MKKILFLFFFLNIQFLFAQLQRLDYPLQKANGMPYRYAWAGGLNNPQFSEIDLDGDLQKDLIVFDRSGNVFLPFVNAGTPFISDYSFAPQFSGNFPNGASRFALFRDYNCDGNEDLFTFFLDINSGQSGISVYKAFRDFSGHVQFQLEKEILNYSEIGQSSSNNILISNIDLPDINDIDGDGDLDILNFNIGGGYVEFFKNNSVENGWNCDSLHFELADNCWGRFYESGITTSLDLSTGFDSCANWTGWTPLRSNFGQRHAGSTLLTLDVNNDGVKELLLGDISFNNLVLAINSGNADTALVLSQNTAFPTGNPVNITAFPAAYYLDVNNDGNKDLLVSPNADDISVNDRVAWLYLNGQTNSQPLFNLEQQDFLVSEMLDLGATAAPVFVDFNADGLKDLIIGNYGIFINASTYRTKLTAFENIGTATSPVFRLSDQDFANLQQYNLKRLVPTFGDLDNDGDFDIILGQEDGTLLLLNNIGSPSSPAFSTPIANYSGIDVGQNAAPQLIDLDRDGDLDLVIGERNGNTNFCENIGTAQMAQFTASINNPALGLIDTKITSLSLDGNSAAHIYNNNGSFLLFMGSEHGTVWVYDSIDNNIGGAYRRISSDFDFIDEGKESIISVADINADGFPEIVVGNKRGGVSIFSGSLPNNLNQFSEKNVINFELFPNPAKDNISIICNGFDDEILKFELYDVVGKLVFDEQLLTTTEEKQFYIKELPDGLYFAILKSSSRSLNKVLVIKN